MARTKSWTESQQPENQYTYGQYVFNVIVVGLLVLGLVAFLFWWLRPLPVSTTHVITVRSNVGDLRAIPFQENDFDQLKNAFDLNSSSMIECDPFDDQQSFENVVHAKIGNLKSEKNDSVVVVCSAVGAIGKEDRKPILRATDGSGEISIEKFLRECVGTTVAQNRIVVLDCGHDFSRPASYFNDSFSPGDDSSLFVDGVGELMKNLEVTVDRPIWVITSTSRGEIPLYSVNQRRTLFSLALQNALAEKHDNVGRFYQSLVAFCGEHGGEAAQTPLLFQSGTGQVAVGDVVAELHLAKLMPKKPTKESDEDTEQAPVQDVVTAKKIRDITDLWNQHEEILGDYESKNLLSPLAFATTNWDSAALEIAEQLVELRNSNGTIRRSDSIQKFEESELKRRAKQVTGQYPGFELSEPPIELSDPEKERRDIARAFANYQTKKLRAKYYAAIFDSLSWLHQSRELDSFKDKLKELTGSINDHAGLFADSSAALENTAEYRRASKELVELDDNVIGRLNNLCRRLSDLHGMTREMAIVNVLESPLIRNAEEPTDSDRATLLELLATASKGSGVRIDQEHRKTNSSDRREIYQQLLGFCQPNQDLNNRPLDAIAYYLSVGKSHLPVPIEFVPRQKIFTAEATATKELGAGKIIDVFSGDDSSPGGQLLDIGLKTEPKPGGLIDLECRLDPQAPFVLYDPKDPLNTRGKEIVIKDSNGEIGIYAETDAESFENANRNFSLSVLIKQTYNGITFSNPQQPFKIPLVLPNRNRVELMVKLGPRDPRRNAPGSSLELRPWPNQAMPIEMFVTNNWHKDRTLRATIYPCLANSKIISGAIDNTTRDQTLRAIENQVRPAISRSAKFNIGPSVDGEPSDSKRIVWPAVAPEADPKDPGPRLATPGEAFPQGLICRIEDLESKDTFDFWLPVFPETREYVAVRPRVKGNSLLLDVTKTEEEFKNRTVKFGWRLSNGPSYDPVNFDSMEESVVAIEDLKAAISEGSRPFLYVDVDGWPRRFVFVYDGLNFTDPNNDKKNRFPDATVSSLRLTEKPPEKPAFQDFKSSDSRVANLYGHRPVAGGKRTLFGTLEINCVINAEQFSFPDTRDFFEIKFGNSLEKYYFPRKIQTTFAPDPETGVWNLTCAVTDFDERREVAGNTFNIDPIRFEFGESSKQLNGSDVTRIIFDKTGPFRPELTIHDKVVQPEIGGVGFEVSNIEDRPGGIGVAKKKLSSIEYILDDKPPQSPRKLKGRPHIGFRAPKELGSHTLKVRVVDQLGNKSELVTGTFEVRKKPKPMVKPVEPVVVPPPPPTHVLLVKVKVASNALKEGQEPELEIKPPDATGKRISGDTFEFTGLKAGVEYTVTGKYKMETGFKIETAGKTTPHEFPKDAKTKHTKTKILKLVGQQ